MDDGVGIRSVKVVIAEGNPNPVYENLYKISAEFLRSYKPHDYPVGKIIVTVEAA